MRKSNPGTLSFGDQRALATRHVLKALNRLTEWAGGEGGIRISSGCPLRGAAGSPRAGVLSALLQGAHVRYVRPR